MTTDAAGGVWTYALDLAEGLAARGVTIVLAVMGPPPSETRRAQAEAIPGLQLRLTGLPLDWLADRPEAVLEAGEAIAGLARDTGAELVHLNSPAHAAGARFPVPVVAVLHSCTATWWDAVREGALPDDFSWRADLLRRGAAAADRLVVPSQGFAEAVMRRYALPQRPVVVHNGRRLMASPGQSSPDVPPVFALTAGRLWDAGKNLATMNAAAAELDLPFFAAGPLAGPDGSQAEAPALRNLGSLEEAVLAEWLSHRPIYVSVALYEPFGLAVVEAAQAGCPLVLSDIPTFRELWDGAAVFVPPRDAAALAQAIARLGGDARERERLGAAARSRAARYSVEAMVEGMLAAYRSAGAEGSAAA
ncbi:glycosyltransferase family 4 protein [Roseomonas sp. SSH11]|uniref:Glycosyltransferase family 4 protein n=2 Tax=Pararoseomonas baculiformis TaxID=2820812 RepID=A0ABS4AB09_9PROT|nr:glycosyltransferase family 4 protein [Pararoseomonas baculiformis]MBP0444183.1 glycosyltransferase family 4 protein [Pararoseomonas baculiformis]